MIRFFRKTEYRISPDRDEWVAPEDTLVDAGSTLSAVEVPVSDSVFRGFAVLTVALALVLVGSVARLGILQYEALSILSFRNRTVHVTVPPPRGVILDRNGVPLVQNIPSFDVLVVSRQVERDAGGALQGIAGLAGALGRPTEELALELEDGIRKNAVFFAATDVPRAQVLALTGAMPSGFSVITNTKRQYVDGIQFSHIIGYVGKVSKKDMAEDSYYLPSDTVGRLGIEAQYENILRGEHGQMIIDATHQTSGEPAKSGANLSLTIDAAVQKQLFNAVWNILRESGLSEAAAVVQNPQDGSILGMVSFPSYDNNVFSTGKLSHTDYQELFENTDRPLFNRVIGGTYNPGSTIKPYIGMAALQEGLVKPTQVVTNDCISISIPNPTNPDDPYVFKNWRPDSGPFDLNRAIADSCNIYFFTVAGGNAGFKGMGADILTGYLKRGGADRVLGIDLPGEQSGFVPTPDWKYTTYKEPWYQGDTYNTSIGQGDLLVTPLWINSYVSAIANGGAVWQPRIGARVVDEQRMTLASVAPVQTGTLPFSADVIESMQGAMRRTVTDGTAKLFRDLPVTAAAKTGTAEVVKGQRINSLVTVYAPAENPQVALTVLVEGSASNQGYALRAARSFLGWYFDRTQTVSAIPTPTPQATAAPTASVSALPEVLTP
jgi:penicillin-binding protein 2